MEPWNPSNPVDTYAAFRLSQHDAVGRQAGWPRTTVISVWVAYRSF